MIAAFMISEEVLAASPHTAPSQIAHAHHTQQILSVVKPLRAIVMVDAPNTCALSLPADSKSRTVVPIDQEILGDRIRCLQKRRVWNVPLGRF